MEVTITENQIQKLPLTTLNKRTLSILISDDRAGKMGLVKYFTENNAPNFGEILKVKERLPDLAKAIGINHLSKLLMAEITKFVNCYTVVRPMNADQIAECAFSLLQSSEEDRLSLPDLIIFFEGAKQGKYGRVLDHIDQHVIFEMLEQYRQQRHITSLRIKEEQDVRFKGLGNNSRTSDERVNAESDIRDVMVDYYKQSIQAQ